MAKTFSFPLYEAVDTQGETIAGPSLDCLRMMIAAQSYERFMGKPAHVLWLATLTPEGAKVFQGR
jgi:hypothetical protein